MSTVKVEVMYSPGERAIIESLTALNDLGCNVSNKDSIIDAPEYEGYKGFHLAAVSGKYPSDLSGSFKLYSDSGYKGYCSKSISDNYGNLYVSFSITFNDIVPQIIAINFDKISQVYAKVITISNSQNNNKVEIYDNKIYRRFIDISTLNIDAGATITLVFTKINKQYSNLKITRLSFSLVGVYDDNIVTEMKCSESLMDTSFNISPTILEQYAELKFKDKYNEFKDLANAEMLNDNLDVNIYIDDILIGSYITDAWEITSTSNNVSLSCVDVSNIFDHIYVTLQNVADRNIDDLLSIAFGYTNKVYGYIDSDTEKYCKSIIVPNSWYKVSTLRDFLIKICVLGLLRMYWYKDKFIVARCY